jgi:hypothetical protein
LVRLRLADDVLEVHELPKLREGIDVMAAACPAQLEAETLAIIDGGFVVRCTSRVVVSCLAASVAFGAMSAPAAAKLRPISGQLSKTGYTVIALTADGRARPVKAPAGSFRLTSLAETVTLHLRAANGTYAGPVVVGRAAGRPITGVRAGARLGRVLVRAGYATLARRLPQRFLDARRWARATDGVPIGAGNFGRVRSRPPRTRVPGDLDADGIPDPLDVDDDGDLVLDNFERPGAAARAAQAPQPTLGLHSVLGGPDTEATVNANARQAADPSVPVFSDAQIDAGLAQRGTLLVGIIAGGEAELDCTGLVYCSAGGTGAANLGDGVHVGPFPGSPGGVFDPDGDGFGTLFQQPGLPPLFYLAHGATTAQIKTGQMMTERVTANGSGENDCSSTGPTTCFVGTVPEVLATDGSAPASYDDGAGVGNSGPISYPIQMGTNPGSAIAITDGADQKLDLTVAVWRPQRRPIPDEAGYGQPGAWTDIGGLSYQVIVGGPDWGISQPHFACPQGSLSTTDSALTPAMLGGTADQTGGFTDGAPDRPADPAHTITYSVNLTQCIAELNAVLDASGSPDRLSWPQGVARPLRFGVRDYGNRIQTVTHLWFNHE